MSIVTYPLNGVTYNAEDAEGYLCTRTSGVFAAEDQFVASVTGDMEVTISPGIAWIKNTNFSGKSIVSRSAVALTVPTADGALPRRDRVVIRFDKTMNATEIKIKTGTPSSAATPPAVERTELVYELGLYTILVPAAALAISDTNITSTMLDESVCGLMQDAVTGISSQQMNAQWEAMTRELAEALNNTQDGNLLTRTQYNAVAPVGGWVMQSDGRFTNSVSVAGVLETDEGTIDVDMTNATVETAKDFTAGWAMVDKAETGNNVVLLTCFYDTPIIDLPIIVEVVR